MTNLVPPWQWGTLDKENTHRLASSNEKTVFGSFDESWYQGRGVFGGLTAATILQAMIELEPSRPPRSFTLQCAAPVLSNPLRLSVRSERRGSKVSHLSARLTNNADGESNESLAFASASFGDARSLTKSIAAESPPSAPPPEEVPEVPKGLALMPAFCQHLSYRFCWDALPYTQREEAMIGGWCALRDPYPIDYPYIAALLDSWAPAIFPCLNSPMRAASVDFSYHFLCPPEALDQLELPFLYKGEVLSLYEGYAEERNWLWDRRGTPVATARQLYAIS